MTWTFNLLNLQNLLWKGNLRYGTTLTRLNILDKMAHRGIHKRMFDTVVSIPTLTPENRYVPLALTIHNSELCP